MSEKPPLGSQIQIFSNSNPSPLGFGTCNSPPALEVLPLIRPVLWRHVNIPWSHLEGMQPLKWRNTAKNTTPKACLSEIVGLQPKTGAVQKKTSNWYSRYTKRQWYMFFQYIPVQNLGDTERGNNLLIWLCIYWDVKFKSFNRSRSTTPHSMSQWNRSTYQDKMLVHNTTAGVETQHLQKTMVKSKIMNYSKIYPLYPSQNEQLTTFFLEKASLQLLC